MNSIRSGRRGFALLEALVSLLLAAFAVVAIVKLQGYTLRSAGESAARSEAVTLAQSKLEELRAGAITRAAFDALPTVSTCDTVSGSAATNASFTRCWSAPATLTGLDARSMQVTVSWTDAAAATQTVALQAVVSWEDAVGQAVFAKPPTGSVIAPVGQAQRGAGQYTPIPAGATQNGDGTSTYTRDDKVRELIDANGNILLYLEPSKGEPQSFTVIRGRIYFDLNNASFLPDPETVKVRLSSEGVCIETGKGNGKLNDLATVGSSAGVSYNGYYDYACYVGPGWYGNVGVTISNTVSGNAANPTICLGDPGFNGGVSNGTLISPHSVPATTRTYRGFRLSGGTYLSTGVEGGSQYPSSGRPRPSEYPTSYPGITTGAATDYFNHHFLLTRITGNTTCAQRMVGGEFTRNAGQYVCINPHDSTDAAVCPVTWPNFESAVGSGGGTVTYALNVSKQGAGTVTAGSVGINCGTACTASVASGTAVTLTATPDTGQRFTGWSGDCTGTAETCTVTMTQARTVAAQFEALPRYGLAVSKAGNGTGTVTSAPAGISCGSTCSATYASGTEVTLTATPDAGQGFSGWSGACTGTAATCTVTLSSADAATIATFTNLPPATNTLTVTKAGTGASSGTVTSSPAGISCGATCSASYNSGTSVTLTAAPPSGQTVVWSGACSGSALTCTVTMNATQAVTATFNPIFYTLSVFKTGTGTVTSSVGGISCGTTCSASVASGTRVTLTAAAGSGQVFSGWGGACTGTGACTLTIGSNTEVTATFAAALCSTPISGSLKDQNDSVLQPLITGSTTSAGSCIKPANGSANYTCSLTAPSSASVTLRSEAQGTNKGTIYTSVITATCAAQQVNF